MTSAELMLALAAVGIGGIVKGAIGAGAPVVAIPILSLIFNVPFAVAVMSFPNLWSNVFQGWVHRSHLLPRRFVLSLALSGAAGLSAPVSVTFLNAMKLERPTFIATISVFFIAMSLVQVPTLWVLGIMGPDEMRLSLMALIALLGGMPIGSWAARHVSLDAFDKLILALLTLVAMRLFWVGFFGG